MSNQVTEQAKKVGEDRVSLLAKYHESQGLVPLDKSDVDSAKSTASLDNASALPKSDEVPAEPKPADAADKAPVGKGEKPAPDAKVTEPEMVTVKALHAEREKRKEKTLEARKLAEEVVLRDKAIAEQKARADALEARLKALETKSVDPKAVKPVNPSDEVARQLAEENRRLKDEAEKKSAEAARLAQEKSQGEINKLIQTADQKLAAEGYPGFVRFTRDVYDSIVAKVQSGELEEKDVTPALWEEVYKNEVYPATRKIFEAQVKQDKAAKKVEQKKAANMVGNPGVAPEALEEEDLDAPQSAESYIKFRKTIK